MASARLGYLDGVEATAKIAAEGSSSPSALIERVADQIVQVMGLESAGSTTGWDWTIRAWNRMGASDGAINPGPSTVLGCLPTRTPSWSWRVGDDLWGGSCCGQARALDLPRPSAWWPPPWVLTATRLPPDEADPGECSPGW